MLTRLFSNTFKNPPNTKCVIWFVTLVSGLVASWLILLEGGRIGDDSVLYLEVARLFSIGAWKDGIALYHWPLYPALITLVHQLTGLNLQYSALLLSVPLYMLASYAFCRLIIEAGGHSKTLWAGALLLFSCTYITRDILPMIMRDQGFWAFYLCSLLFLLRFYKQNRWQDSLLWQVCTIVAVLFRVEGITYLMLLPFIMLTRTECSLRERVKHLAAAQSLTLLGAVTVILGLLTIPSLKFSDLGRLDESFTVLQRAYLQLSHGLIDKAHIIGDQVLGSFLSDYGMQGLILTLIAIIIGKVAGASGWPSLLLACMPIKPDNPSPGTEVRRFFYWVMGLGLVNLCVILLSNFILPGRVAIPVAWIILLFAAFSLASQFEAWKANRTRLSRGNIIFWIIVACLGINLVGNALPHPPGYNSEQNAVAWIKQNTGKDSRVFYDTPRLRYYAGEPFVDRGIASWDRVTKAVSEGEVSHYDYLVIHTNTQSPEQQQYLATALRPHQLVATVATTSKHKKILIFALDKADQVSH